MHMKANIQLNIPKPCHERWADMQLEEQGRFCGACKKTVVDLSAMSDREIIQYLSRAGQQVCGRMSPDQVDRGMALEPVAAKGWRGWWHWVLAGLLVSSKATAQQGVKAGVEQVQRADRAPLVLGKIARLPVKDTLVKDSIKVKVLPEAVVTGYGRVTCHKLSGAISYVMVRVDSPMQWVKDTLSTLGLAPKKEMAVYPNPVRKGGAVSLNWQGTEPGMYRVAIFNAGGAMVEERAMEVSSKEQVDLLEIPASLPGGVYFLRAASAGDGRSITRKVVVL